MTEWLKLDPKKFNEAREKTIHGVHVEAFSSPYDVPEAVRGFFDKDTERCIFEFKYIGGDEPETDITDDHIVLSVGKHSKRLYRIEIPWSEEKVREHASLNLSLVELGKVLRDLATKIDAERRSVNYEVAKKILSERVEELSQQVSA